MGYDLYVYKHSGKYVDVWLHKTYGVAMTNILFNSSHRNVRQRPEVSNELKKKLYGNDDYAAFKTEDVLGIIKDLEKTALYKTIDRYGLCCTKTELRSAINELKKAYELSKDEDFMFFVISV